MNQLPTEPIYMSSRCYVRDSQYKKLIHYGDKVKMQKLNAMLLRNNNPPLDRPKIWPLLFVDIFTIVVSHHPMDGC